METSRRDEEEKVPGIPGRARRPGSARLARPGCPLGRIPRHGPRGGRLAVQERRGPLEGRFEVVPEVKSLEKDSDRAEVRIEQECLRVLALFEPVASDLRRLATILKVSRDWERIADLAARIARRARKLAKRPNGVPIPEPLKSLARDVLTHVAPATRLCPAAIPPAREVILGDRLIDRQYRLLRRELKESLRQHAEQFDAWLQLMNTARNLERIADHATEIAQTIVYLQEGVIIRHQSDSPAIND